MKVKLSCFLIMLLFFISSCNDNVPIQVNDIDKYPWLKPFIIPAKPQKFDGTHNIDLGTLQFKYNISANPSSFIQIIDSVANSGNWKKLRGVGLKRTFSKIDSSIGKEHVVDIEVDAVQKKALFVVK